MKTKTFCTYGSGYIQHMFLTTLGIIESYQKLERPIQLEWARKVDQQEETNFRQFFLKVSKFPSVIPNKKFVKDVK